MDGLLDGSIGFGGEESAGASFLRRDGTVWTTDKDGIICCLLAAELTARRGADPGAQYRELTERFGDPAYRRVDAPATPEQKAVLKRLSAGDVQASELAGEPITDKLTEQAEELRRVDGREALRVLQEAGTDLGQQAAQLLGFAVLVVPLICCASSRPWWNDGRTSDSAIAK